MGIDDLKTYLGRIPGINSIATSGPDIDPWWVKFHIDIDSSLAWNVVQELGCVLNYLSVTERLPTRFLPISPAPYLNGGPRSYLSWLIEPVKVGVDPGWVAQWLEGRLPRPVEDVSKWPKDD